MFGVSNSFSATPAQVESVALSKVTDDATLLLPAGSAIRDIIIRNNAKEGMLGGVQIGSEPGAADVLEPHAIRGLAFLTVDPLIHVFSATIDQTLYVSATEKWTGASLDLTVRYDRAGGV